MTKRREKDEQSTGRALDHRHVSYGRVVEPPHTHHNPRELTYANILVAKGGGPSAASQPSMLGLSRPEFNIEEGDTGL